VNKFFVICLASALVASHCHAANPLLMRQVLKGCSTPTDAVTFSSPGGWNSADRNRLRVNVQAPPITVYTMSSIPNPVDLKWMPPGQLYVLSGGSAATITEWDVTGNSPPSSPTRTITGIGSNPTGLDVDSSGNIYVALNGDNQVAKYKEAGGSFQLVTAFGSGGKIGAAGSGNGQFNAPYDVAVTPDGSQISVSDSGNNRIQSFDSGTGQYLSAFGQQGSAVGQFSAPKGLTYGGAGYLFIVDSGNSRVCLALPPAVLGASGAAGSQPGQFQGPVNIGVGARGIYVAETGNSRVQPFDPLPTATGAQQTPFTPRSAVLSGISLNTPNSVASVYDLLQEKIYIADTGNNRVLLVKLPGDDPTSVWATMVDHATSGDISGAISTFSAMTAGQYQQAFFTAGNAAIASAVGPIRTLSPVSVMSDTAEYYFEQQIAGQTITFPVKFVKENGVWKILEF
jgi:WD40 repeat protein